MKRKSNNDSLSKQMKNSKGKSRIKNGTRIDTDNSPKVTTGSTLLDLAISGSVCRYGGLPAGIMTEVFGPPASGKTALLCEVAGVIQRNEGQALFRDPEGRLNRQYARQFDLDVDKLEYSKPDTVKEIFEPIREWAPEPKDRIHGILADSLAALSTSYELTQGDNRGQSRAKEFSTECRKTCRTLTNKGYLMLCSNQVRQNDEEGAFAQKYKTPGGEAIAFYSSVRLRLHSPQRIKKKVSYKGKEQRKAAGVVPTVEVYKNSVGEPFNAVPVHIVFDYGIDDVRANLQWLKTNASYSTYQVNGKTMGQGLDEAVLKVEELGVEEDLIEEVVETWHEIQEKFRVKRKKKKRTGGAS